MEKQNYKDRVKQLSDKNKSIRDINKEKPTSAGEISYNLFFIILGIILFLGSVVLVIYSFVKTIGYIIAWEIEPPWGGGWVIIVCVFVAALLLGLITGIREGGYLYNLCKKKDTVTVAPQVAPHVAPHVAPPAVNRKQMSEIRF